LVGIGLRVIHPHVDAGTHAERDAVVGPCNLHFDEVPPGVSNAKPVELQ
jgi:hypothetical protein